MKGKYTVSNEDEIDLKGLAQIIRSRRMEVKLKQKDVAFAAGRSRSYIADIEGGRYLPSVITLLKISKIIGLDLNKLKNLVTINE